MREGGVFMGAALRIGGWGLYGEGKGSRDLCMEDWWFGRGLGVFIKYFRDLRRNGMVHA